MNLFIIILFSLPVLYLLYNIILYLKTGVPIVITPSKYYLELFKFLKIQNNSVIYELGCGRADFLFAAEKFKPKKLIGFELSIIHFTYSKIKAQFLKSKVKILCRNFFKADISDADIIYLFLVESVVIKIWNKIKRETKPGTIVIILSNELPTETYLLKIPTRPNETKSTFYYIYKV